MKMLVITSIKEDARAVSRIMDKADIPAFSVTETTGHTTAFVNLQPDIWFGKSNDGEHSLFFFSFTEDGKAAHAVELVKLFNRKSHTKFPLRAFVLPVEQAGY